MIDVNNDFVEEHISQLIDFQMKEVSWQYDYDSIAVSYTHLRAHET